MSDRYDVIVVGLGGMGSAAFHELARRGLRVLGLEQFDIPHAMGSYHGLTRIIRLAYHEHPGYVPLLRRAFERWRALEADAGRTILHVTGSVDVAPATHPVFAGSLRSCELHGLTHEALTATELARRFPAYRFPSDAMALWQPDGGFLEPEAAVVAYVQLAQRLGATARAREPVLGWEPAGGGVRVDTARGTYRADRLVLCGGAWMAKLVPRLAALAVPERQVLAWLQPTEPELFEPARFPVFNCAVEEGEYYGFPVFAVPGFKFGRFRHLGQTVDPDTMDRECHPADEAMLRRFAERYFPAGTGPTMSLKACMFTNSPDHDFIVDRLPDCPEVAVAAGFSGHGFKFCSVVGEVLADLAERGSTSLPIEMLRLGRFPPS